MPDPAGELRFDPLTREWVNIVGARQARPNLPDTGCPFCVGGLEAPRPYDVRWFRNRWPALAPGDGVDFLAAEASGTTRVPAVGACEVVLFSPDHDESLGTLPVAQVRKVVDLWAERTVELLARPEVEYVLVFENRGREVGATIDHPHGQIYGYPFVPPTPAREGEVARGHGCAICAEIAGELESGTRVVTTRGDWVAWVPYASGYPYGMRLAGRAHRGGLAGLDDESRNDLAALLVDALGRYDRLWPAPDPSYRFPYLLWFHQAPASGGEEWHVHAHVAPPLRAPGVARYVASGEVGSGTLSNPVVPEAAAQALRERVNATRRFRAPGRVNLIGGQVDYHEGWVVSLAIDREVIVDATPRADGRIVAHSSDFDGVVDIAADGRDDPPATQPQWGRIVAGVTRVLAELGRAPVGTDLTITSTLPVGAGLSSSAALEVACTLALCDAAGFELTDLDLALASQRSEHVATGVPCGIQDQIASVCGRADHALFLDCRTLSIEHLPLPSELSVLVVHSGVPRTLEASPYARRRADSEDVAARLGLRVLRDATLEQVRDLPRGRHAVTEMTRVREFAAALRTNDLDALGPLMLASHASSRDDMEVSIPELDTLVECLVEAGAYGARLTGAGFGGCVVALGPAEAAANITERAGADYRARTAREPIAWVVRAADGANCRAG